MRNNLSKISLILTLLFGVVIAYGQGCAQCKAQVESSANNELMVGNGLNDGIAILMIAPYILLAIIPLVIFRKQFFGFVKDFIGMWKS